MPYPQLRKQYLPHANRFEASILEGLDIYTIDGQKHINFDSISDTAEEFKENISLMKTHKSYLININNISSVKVVPGGREVTFKGLPDDLVAKITSDALDEFERRFGKT